MMTFVDPDLKQYAQICVRTYFADRESRQTDTLRAGDFPPAHFLPKIRETAPAVSRILCL